MKPQLTIEAFADWCEKQPAEKTYDWIDGDACAACQYARSLGLYDAWASRHLAPSAVGNFLIQASRAAHGSRTFGALASRLRRSAS
jgi:hypothetical protein